MAASSPDLIQVIGILASAASGAGALVSSYIEHPDEKYGEKVKKLQKDRWSEVSTELGELMSDVEDSIDESNGPDQEDLTKSAKYSLVIQKEYNKDQIGGVLEKLDEVDVPKTHFRTCREARDRAVSRFVQSLGASLIGLLLIAFSNGQDLDMWGTLLVGGGGALLVSGVNAARMWRDARQELDKMWEEYDFM